MTHADTQELSKEGKVQRICDFLSLHSCPPTDNDDPFSSHISCIRNNGESLEASRSDKPDNTNSLESPFLKNLLHPASSGVDCSLKQKDRVLVMILHHHLKCGPSRV